MKDAWNFVLHSCIQHIVAYGYNIRIVRTFVETSDELYYACYTKYIEITDQTEFES